LKQSHTFEVGGNCEEAPTGAVLEVLGAAGGVVIVVAVIDIDA